MSLSYDTEIQVGKGIKASGVPREEIFLGTKLWCNSHHPDDVEAALDASLKDLDTPYVDLFLMHYPCTFQRGEDRFPKGADGKMIMGKTTFVDTWKAMEALLKTGKTKAIGVSNFSKDEVQTLIDKGSVVRFTQSQGKKIDCEKGHMSVKLTTSKPRFPPSTRWNSTPTSNKSPSSTGSAQTAST